ncbi:MAG: DHA2 family efflux MFS transporter permease subunit [Candidatus Pristimantibacillus lignocellulolyticus]|uniref:DHA2 family efflux MFS transporter permease subunit n=1 Tax=Candidatus Pristimantibacillus lignocellulolyticus TaxID=2994561 RepID=A0A9J6ZHD0_9BACL|nr:MAG: DHA2 family efflux MFS transporter permease subunit [Candidatus Pristimantibacillus lignocellulolyticus]
MNNSASSASLQSQGIANVKRLPIMISLIIGAFFSILNETLLSNAIPQLVIELNVTASTLQWLSTGYMLVVAVLIPASALLVQWFTTRQVFLGAMTLFTIGTIVCGIAPGFSVLLIGRLLQALGTGLMMPVLMNTILLLYPPEKRGGAMGTIGLVIMFAPAIGPTLSGIILDSLEWRWLFFIVLPFALFSIIFAFIYLKNLSQPTKPRVDVISILLSTIGFGGIVYGFSSSYKGWDQLEVYGMIGVGLIALLLFVIRQLKLKEPLLDLRAFKFPMFTLTTILLIIMMMTMFSTMALLPFLFQGALGLTVYASGLIMLPGSLLNGLISPITGKLFDKFGPRALMVPGTVVLAIVMWFFTQVSADTSKTTFIILHICLMVAISMIMMPAQTNGLNQLPPRYYPHGTAILNTLSQVAGAIGFAFFISIMSAGQKSYLAESTDPTSVVEQIGALVSGIHNAFVIGFGFAIIAIIVAFFTKRAKTSVE